MLAYLLLPQYMAYKLVSFKHFNSCNFVTKKIISIKKQINQHAVPFVSSLWNRLSPPTPPLTPPPHTRTVYFVFVWYLEVLSGSESRRCVVTMVTLMNPWQYLSISFSISFDLVWLYTSNNNTHRAPPACFRSCVGSVEGDATPDSQASCHSSSSEGTGRGVWRQHRCRRSDW